MSLIKCSVIFCTQLLVASVVQTQDPERPSIAAGSFSGTMKLDGTLDEVEWNNAPVLSDFRTLEPQEGLLPSVQTEVRVLAHPRTIIIGIRCEDLQENIVSFSKIRDADLEEEDHIRIVLDPFLDGQSGYILALNANGARYDALVSNRGESENDEWDAVWEAATKRDGYGWSAEIRIPIQSISFKKGLTSWGFNVERHIQRNQETIRWANVQRDQWFIQTSRAGVLTNLPDFSYGLGLNIRPSFLSGISQPGDGAKADFSFEPSLDVSQRLSPNVIASVTVNTDFAETEVDTRQTNLTRFPLFFPEKRSFFLEGSDIFEFGLGTGSSTVLPFFSRHIGLYDGNAVDVNGGAKLNGRIGKTAFGGLVTHTGEYTSPEDTLSGSTMGVVRVRQNIFRESSVGLLATMGDPLSRHGSWMSGADFTFQTTRFQGDKNLLLGGWGLFTNREDLEGDRSAVGLKLDYPNDLWDIAFTYARIGDAFDPSLGFVPRAGIHYLRAGMTYAPRPKWQWMRQMFHELFVTYIMGLDGRWQTYGIFTAPINWKLESGDRIEFNIYPQGENLTEPFEIEDDVIVPSGAYHFTRYRLESEFAAKRRVSGEVTWWFGDFYNGKLDEIEISVEWKPSAEINIEVSGERNIGRLDAGDFDQTLLGLLLRLNITPDLQINSFVQYDTESRVFGLNARVHWIFSPLGDAFLVFNHNSFNDFEEGWMLEDRQILAKVRYNFRM